MSDFRIRRAFQVARNDGGGFGRCGWPGRRCWTRSDKLSAMPGHDTAFGKSRCQALCVTRGLDPRVHTSLQRSLTAGSFRLRVDAPSPGSLTRSDLSPPADRTGQADFPHPALGQNFTPVSDQDVAGMPRGRPRGEVTRCRIGSCSVNPTCCSFFAPCMSLRVGKPSLFPSLTNSPSFCANAARGWAPSDDCSTRRASVSGWWRKQSRRQPPPPW